MRRHLVFSYGSNLWPPRLASRAPGAVVVDAASLPGHALRWHKAGRDGSGKCDAFATGDPRDVVHGVVHEMGDEDKRALDRAEGLGEHYVEKTVRVVTRSRGELDVTLYVARRDRIDPSLRPDAGYKAFVTRGARIHGLPPEYVEALDAVGAVDAVEALDAPEPGDGPSGRQAGRRHGG